MKQDAHGRVFAQSDFVILNMESSFDASKTLSLSKSSENKVSISQETQQV